MEGLRDKVQPILGTVGPIISDLFVLLGRRPEVQGPSLFILEPRSGFVELAVFNVSAEQTEQTGLCLGLPCRGPLSGNHHM